jgi:hypothetical protein
MADRDPEQLRRDFPLCLAFADELRAAFGPGVRLTYMKEGGQEIGHDPRGDGVKGVSLAQMVIEPKEEPKKSKAPAQRGRNSSRDKWTEEHERENIRGAT